MSFLEGVNSRSPAPQGPPGMTKVRAQYILEKWIPLTGFHYSFQGPMCGPSQFFADGITPTEDHFVRIIWSMMREDKTYFDAVCEIAKGV